MKVARFKFWNVLVNVLAVLLLLGTLYAVVAFIIIPVATFMWAASVNSMKEGYQQFFIFTETFSHWDNACYLLLGVALYLLPTIIACIRKHPSKRSIFFINLFFGWSVIGWILVAIWCRSSVKAPLV